MALATTTTPGSIILGGDLTGVANAPELRVTGVTAGTYTYPTIVVDAKGRTIYATSGSAPVLAGDVGGNTAASVLPTINSTIGSFAGVTLTVNSKGFITAANATLLSGAVSGPFGATALPTTGVSQGSYTIPSITVNDKGFITSIASGTFSGVLTGQINSTSLTTTGITAGSYAAASLTVNASGRITAVSNGASSFPDATYTTKGILSVSPSDRVVVGSGAIQIQVTSGNASSLSSKTPVYVNGTTSELTITAGNIVVSANIPKLNSRAIFTKALNTPAVIHTSSTLTPDLASIDIYRLNRSDTTTINAPVSALDGQIFKICCNGYDATRLISQANNLGGTGNEFTNFIWTGTYFFATGGVAPATMSSKTAKSTDGVSWTIYNNALPDWDYWTVAWSPTLSRFCGITEYGNRVVTSSDGINWTTHLFPSGLPFGCSYHSGIVWHNNKFVIIFDGTSVLTSSDGITWSSATLSAGNQRKWKQLISGGGRLVAISQSPSTLGYITSTDGVSWTSANITGYGSLVGRVGQPAYSSTHNMFAFGIVGPFGRNVLFTYVPTDAIPWQVRYLTTSDLPTTPDTAVTVYAGGQFLSFEYEEKDFAGSNAPANKYVNYDPSGSVGSAIRSCQQNLDILGGAVVGDGKIVMNNFTHTLSYDGIVYDSSYKFSNSLATFNSPFVLECVYYNGTSYCTYNK